MFESWQIEEHKFILWSLFQKLILNKYKNRSLMKQHNYNNTLAKNNGEKNTSHDPYNLNQTKFKGSFFFRASRVGEVAFEFAQ